MARKSLGAGKKMREEFKESVKEDHKLHGVVTKAMKKVTAHEKAEKKSGGKDKD